MKYPKILLTGGSGQVGHELKTTLRRLGEVWAPGRQAFDLADPESLREKIRDYQPDLIVNPAAYTAVDLAESEPTLANTINADAPKIMAEEAYKLGIPLVHYSTNYVFDGTKTEPYTEADEPNPLNIYGRTKLEGERAIQQAHDQYLILRTSWVYSPTRGKNFYCTMLRLFQEKEDIRVVDDQIGAPTSAHFLADKTAAILQCLRMKTEGEQRWGIYHLTEPETMSWYEFAERILVEEEGRDVFKTKAIRPIRSDEYPTMAKRPGNSVLDLQKIHDAFLSLA
jgi:dTDP-4-dehydrorhamnose reductase